MQRSEWIFSGLSAHLRWVSLPGASLLLVSHPRTKLSALETALRRISQVGAKEFPEVARPMEEARQAARERQGKRTDLTSGPREPEVTRSAAAIARQLGISGS